MEGVVPDLAARPHGQRGIPCGGERAAMQLTVLRVSGRPVRQSAVGEMSAELLANRCRGGSLTTEESLWINGRGEPQRTNQLVIVGEISSLGGEIGWQFRRTS